MSADMIMTAVYRLKPCLVAARIRKSAVINSVVIVCRGLAVNRSLDVSRRAVHCDGCWPWITTTGFSCRSQAGLGQGLLSLYLVGAACAQ